MIRITWASTNYRRTIGGLSVDYRWTIGGLSVDYRWTIGGLSVDTKKTKQGCAHFVFLPINSCSTAASRSSSGLVGTWSPLMYSHGLPQP
ncbi:hypothetical protein AB4Z30_18905 [Paenibacillus sp. 2TAF8]|uniref:hypothetical protein n=1 Tax=Paenibacillus sp. 2TAF8 TaxID=3233020 RepID=UPI003F9C73F9